ncbi:MAG: ATP synthase F0 subunit B [Desulfobacterales bacterium]
MKFFGIRCKNHPRSKSFDRCKTFNLVWIVLIVLMFFVGPACALAAGDEHGGHWVATDTYRVINFAVLAIGLFFLLRKPVAQALGSRIKGIRDQLENLEARKVEAEKELASYVEKLSKLEEEAEGIIEDYIRQGNEAKNRIIKEAEVAAVKLEEQAKKNIEHEFEKAKIMLKEDVLEKAMARAEEIIQEKISTDDQERLVDDYLNKVVA